MFKALPQDELYGFNPSIATVVGADNDAVLTAANEFSQLGIKSEVWAIESIFCGETELYYVCFVYCTPAKLLFHGRRYGLLLQRH